MSRKYFNDSISLDDDVNDLDTDTELGLDIGYKDADSISDKVQPLRECPANKQQCWWRNLIIKIPVMDRGRQKSLLLFSARNTQDH